MAYYKTSDGNVFYTQNAAENHAKTLQDKTVITTETEKAVKITKQSESIEETTVEASEQSEESEETNVDVADETVDSEEVKTEISEYDNLTKKELLDIASQLGLSTSDRYSKQQIIMLITNAKKSQ